jgi:hypothetical protein
VIPRPDSALMDLAARIGSTIAPAMPTSYGAADAGIISMLMMALAREAASGVERRMADGRELKALFEEAVHAPDADRRNAYQTGEPASVSHADVSEWLDQGLELLIELHAWAELHDEDLNAGIWDFLERHTERHKLDF